MPAGALRSPRRARGRTHRASAPRTPPLPRRPPCARASPAARRCRPASCGGASNRHVVDADGGKAHADGHALAVLAAGAHARIVRGVGADGGDVFERLWADADEHRALHGFGDLALLDQVRLADLEDEVAVGDVDLPAAELPAVDAAIDLADDLLGRLVSGREIRVGHARQRRVAEALAAPRAGAALPGELRVQVIVEIALEHAVLDQHFPLARVAFVVDVDGAAPSRDGAVVDHGDE